MRASQTDESFERAAVAVDLTALDFSGIHDEPCHLKVPQSMSEVEIVAWAREAMRRVGVDYQTITSVVLVNDEPAATDGPCTYSCTYTFS